MLPSNRISWLTSAAGVLMGCLLLLMAGLRIPGLDTRTDAYFEEAITKAGLAYATCRTVNASVSIIKESNLQLEPAGIGLSLAVGQALDPVDDMTERLSDVLVTAITSLGVQKLAYTIFVSVAPVLVGTLLILLSLLALFPSQRIRMLQRVCLKLIVILMVARFCLPVSSLANDYLQSTFFDQEIETAKKELALGSAEMDRLKDISLPEIDGVAGTLRNSAAFLSQKSIEFRAAMISMVSNMGLIMQSLLTLTFLYVGLFVIQVILLPIGVFWLLIKILNLLFQANLPVILHPHRSSAQDPS